MELWILEVMQRYGAWQDVERFLFAEPMWLHLLWAWPLMLLLWWFSKPFLSVHDDLSEQQGRHNFVAKHPLIERWSEQSPSYKSKRSSSWMWVMHGLRGLLAILLIVALAQPMLQKSSNQASSSYMVRDISLVIESSVTFLLPDYYYQGQSLTRMQAVKQVLDDFIAQLDNNRFQLVVYADEAYTLLPMTADTELARLSLNRLQPYLAGRNDTAMGEALGLALQPSQPSKGATETAGNQDRPYQVVVLISDGLSLPSRVDLVEAVNYAQWRQIPIYTIGVGSSSEQADKRETSGLIYQPLESDSLQVLAQETGGRYFQVDSSEQIETVLKQIERESGHLIERPPEPQPPLLLYPYLLMAALLVWLLYAGLSAKVGSRLQDRGQGG